MEKNKLNFFNPFETNLPFSLNIKEKTNFDSLYRHIESYLGEYRFQLPIYHYRLKLQDGRLIDPSTQEPMVDKARRALEKRQSLGLSFQREEAELKALDYLGKNLKPMDTLVWISPPGEQKDGYGSYGFFFYGFVNNNGDIEMTARRVEMTEEEFEKKDFSRFAETLYQITDNQFLNMTTDIDFLSSPIILRLKEGVVDIEKIIELHFGKIDLEKLRLFSQQIEFLRPVINHFIEVYLEGKADNFYLTSLFNTIENLALSKNISRQNFDPRLIPLDRLIQYFGYTPPQVFGSCGSTSSNQNNQSLIEKLTELPFLTSNILRKLELYSDNEDEYGSLTFHCPACNNEHTRPRGKLLTHCPTTGKEIPKC